VLDSEVLKAAEELWQKLLQETSFSQVQVSAVEKTVVKGWGGVPK